MEPLNSHWLLFNKIVVDIKRTAYRISKPEHIVNLYHLVDDLIIANRRNSFWALSHEEQCKIQKDHPEKDFSEDQQLCSMVAAHVYERIKSELPSKYQNDTLYHQLYEDLHGLRANLQYYSATVLDTENLKLAFYDRKDSDSLEQFFKEVRVAVRYKFNRSAKKIPMHGQTERVIAGLSNDFVAPYMNSINEFINDKVNERKSLDSFLEFLEFTLKSPPQAAKYEKELEEAKNLTREEALEVLRQSNTDSRLLEALKDSKDEIIPVTAEVGSEEYYNGFTSVSPSPFNGDGPKMVKHLYLTSSDTMPVEILDRNKFDSDRWSVSALYEIQMLYERKFFDPVPHQPPTGEVHFFTHGQDNGDLMQYKHITKLVQGYQKNFENETLNNKISHCEIDIETLRICLAVGTQNKLNEVVKWRLTEVHNWGHRIVVDTPAYSVEKELDENKSWIFRKPIPGMKPECTKSSPAAIKSALTRLGFKNVEYGVYIKLNPTNECTMVMRSLDELLVMGNSKDMIEDLFRSLSRLVPIADLGFPDQFLGVEIKDIGSGSIGISTSKFEERFKQEFQSLVLPDQDGTERVTAEDLNNLMVFDKVGYDPVKLPPGYDASLLEKIPKKKKKACMRALMQLCFLVKCTRFSSSIFVAALAKHFKDLRVIHYNLIRTAVTQICKSLLRGIPLTPTERNPIVESELQIRYNPTVDTHALMNYNIMIGRNIILWQDFYYLNTVAPRFQKRGAEFTYSDEDFRLILSSIALSRVPEIDHICSSMGPHNRLAAHKVKTSNYPDGAVIPPDVRNDYT